MGRLRPFKRGRKAERGMTRRGPEKPVKSRHTAHTRPLKGPIKKRLSGHLRNGIPRLLNGRFFTFVEILARANHARGGIRCTGFENTGFLRGGRHFADPLFARAKTSKKTLRNTEFSSEFKTNTADGA